MKFSILLVVAVMALILVSSCTKEKIISPTPTTYKVTGTVYGWRCYICDPVNNGGTEHRYSVITGFPAVVKLVREGSCCTVWDVTDDSSQFEIEAEAGEYFAVVETAHCHPDTIEDITINGDTTMGFHTLLEYLVGDTVIINYYYPNPSDTLGYDEEWRYIRYFNSWVDDLLNLDGTERTETYIKSMNWLNVDYHIPTKEGYSPWQIYDKSLRVLNGHGVPENFRFYLTWYICMDKR